MCVRSKITDCNSLIEVKCENQKAAPQGTAERDLVLKQHGGEFESLTLCCCYHA